MTEIFVGEKEKWTNKGTDKQYVADSLLHSSTCHTQPLNQILGQEVAKKALTENLHMRYIGVRDGKKENLKKKEKYSKK